MCKFFERDQIKRKCEDLRKQSGNILDLEKLGVFLSFEVYPGTSL